VIAGFSASGALAQATKLVFEERNADVKTLQELGTNGRIETSWRATGGQFQLTALDPSNDSKLISNPPQSREGDEYAPMVGKLPFSRQGKLKFQVKASGPLHIRVIEFNSPN